MTWLAHFFLKDIIFVEFFFFLLVNKCLMLQQFPNEICVRHI